MTRRPASVTTRAIARRPGVRVLALATSTEWCSVALLVRDGGEFRVDELDERAGNEHSRRVLPMARALLARAGFGFGDLDAIGFDAGPGSFTGIRIGCGVAQGLGFGLALPVAAVPSLEALAWQADAPLVVAAMDARMGEVYLSAYRCALGGGDAVATRPSALAPMCVLPSGQAAERIAQWAVDSGFGGGAVEGAGCDEVGSIAARMVLVGDAAARYPVFRERLDGIGVRSIDDTHARAASVARLAECRLAGLESLDAALAAPIYVRDKVALDVDEQRLLRARHA